MSESALRRRWNAGTRVSRDALSSARLFALGLTIAFATPAVWLFADGIDPLGVAEMVALALFALNAVWVSAGAATSVVGLSQRGRESETPPNGRSPSSRTAILYLICGEPPHDVARAASALRRDLRRHGLGQSTDIVILSDTSGDGRTEKEEAVLVPLAEHEGIAYRRRAEPVRRKPGNLAEWHARAGHHYDSMLVLDADSRMTASRISSMIYAMEREPDLGLIQAGMRLAPMKSHFGRLQRLSSRLVGPVFVRGLAAWAGDTGNYWGHNALIRTRAFAECAQLPRLHGSAPFGGEILSHDFVEAAWLRRAGWRVRVSADTRGSFESGPERVEEYHRRDRRWCQGNLQHARLLAEPGLHPLSRLHLLTGVQSYLASPIWLALVLATAFGWVGSIGFAPFAALALVLLAPKICGAADRLRRVAGRARRIIAKGVAAELFLTTLIAPILMIRHTLSVLSVVAGRDCGWKTAGRSRNTPAGGVEAASGFAIAGAAAAFAPEALPWLAPICLPLISAPWLVRWLDAQPAR